MIALQWLTLILAIAVTLACICRLDVLNPKEHRARVFLLAISMTLSAAWGGYKAWLMQADLGDFFAVMASGMWLFITLSSWMHGVPEHFKKPWLRDDWTFTKGQR